MHAVEIERLDDAALRFVDRGVDAGRKRIDEPHGFEAVQGRAGRHPRGPVEALRTHRLDDRG